MAFGFIAGLGMQEILLLGLCFMMSLVPVVVVVVVLVINRKKKADSGSERVRELEQENRRLRDDLEGNKRDN